MRAGEVEMDPLGISVCVCVCCFSWAALDSLLTFTKITAGRLLQFQVWFVFFLDHNNLKSRWREKESAVTEKEDSSVVHRPLWKERNREKHQVSREK